MSLLNSSSHCVYKNDDNTLCDNVILYENHILFFAKLFVNKKAEIKK